MRKYRKFKICESFSLTDNTSILMILDFDKDCFKKGAKAQIVRNGIDWRIVEFVQLPSVKGQTKHLDQTPIQIAGTVKLSDLQKTIYELVII